jgi:tRNA(fMet)-specific endonuclease VapC
MRYTFDTNILSYYIKGNDAITRRLKNELSSGSQFFINPISYYEINRGLLAIDSQRKLSKFRTLCQLFGVLDLSKNALDIAAKHYAILRKRGQLIEDADLFIAAVCIDCDLTLITNNEKHFALIDGLIIENWVD